MDNKKLNIPKILIPELTNLEKRLDKSYVWVSANKNNIDKNIDFIQAMKLYDFGIDVTQIRVK